MRHLSYGLDWGTDTATLLKIYQTHIRSKLDYGCAIYGSARESSVTGYRTLHYVYVSALICHICHYMSLPAASLQVESGDFPLELRQNKLRLQYTLKLSSTPYNPASDCI